MSLLRRVGRRFLAGDILSSEASPHAVGRLFTVIVSHLAAPSEASPLPPLQALIGILSASSEPPLPSPLEGVRSPSPLPLPRATKQPFIGIFSPFKSYPLQVIRESLPLVGHSSSLNMIFALNMIYRMNIALVTYYLFFVAGPSSVT